MSAKSKLLATAVLLLAAHAWGAEIAAQYACKATMNAERFARALIDKRVVDGQPYSTADSISYYAAKPGFTAFGLPLVAVTVFQEGSAFFHRAAGTSPGNIIGLVVQAGAGELESAAGKQGVRVSNPKSMAYPQISVEWFEGSGYAPLPPPVEPRYKYAQLVCHIGFSK